MSWNLDSDRPIFLQIIEHIQMDIISGTYAPGSKLPSVRELASFAAVNPNTMQKALAELERENLVFAQRTSGRYITEDKKVIEEVKRALALTEIDRFFDRMKQLGFGKEEILTLIEKAEEGEDSNDNTQR